jgi:hypothetical protein
MGGNLVIYPMKTCVLIIYNSLCAEPGTEGNRGVFALDSQICRSCLGINVAYQGLARVWLYYGYGSPVIMLVIFFSLHFYIILKINSIESDINFIPY